MVGSPAQGHPHKLQPVPPQPENQHNKVIQSFHNFTITVSMSMNKPDAKTNIFLKVMTTNG